MLEKEIELKLISAINAIGGKCLKWVSPSYVGVPDRIILLPNSVIAFAELKAPGRKPRPIQLKRHQELRALGFKVYVIDSEDGIKACMEELCNS